MTADLSNIYMLFGVVTIGLWYYIKFLVHRAGYETHLFWGHGADIQNLHQLIDREQDTRKKWQLRIVLLTFYASFTLALAAFVVTIVWFR
jgi:hypothetical protein